MCSSIFLYMKLSPETDTNEQLVHNAARKSGISLDCNLSYLDLPLCVGHTDDGTAMVEVQPWPFLLPSDMATETHVKIFLKTPKDMKTNLGI